MAFAVADRVKETSTTTGTGTLNLAGAEPGYQTFVAGVGNGNTTYYAIVNRATSEFEVGIGTVTDAATDTLSRDTIISSSNSDLAVNFSAGTKDVICTLPSEKSYVIDNASNTSISANLTATAFSGSGASLTSLNASNLASGTLPDATFPATLPATSGANLTGLNASNLASGTVPDARFPATIPASSGANLTNLNASNVSSGTLPDARFPATLPNISGANLTTLNASNVSSGTLSSDRLTTVPTTKGGTGLTTIGTANQVLAVNGTGTGLEYQTISADITGVTAGSGLTGGGTSGDVTLNVGAGTGIDVAADSIAVDVSDFMSNGSNNRVLTATGTDAMNAESGLTYDGSTLAVTGVVTETSSIDYKENVKPLEFNDAIYNVNAVKYDFKDGSQKDEVGVIAEELYKVLPDLVTTKDGKPEAVKYTKMTMYLLEALKKQNQEIQELKKRLN